MSELERAIAQEEKSPDLAAVTRYHLEGLKRALARLSERSRSKVFASLLAEWCLKCGCSWHPGECSEEVVDN